MIWSTKGGAESNESQSQRQSMSRQQNMWDSGGKSDIDGEKSIIVREEAGWCREFKELFHLSSSLLTRGTFEVTY